MALSDADFAWRFFCGEQVVTIECDRRTCFAYAGPMNGDLGGDCWLFNLVEAPETFRPRRGEPPMNDRVHARPFDLGETVDPASFLVTLVEEEFFVWYADRLIGIVYADGRVGRSIYATAPNRLVVPLDRPVALHRYWNWATAIVRHVLDLEDGRFALDRMALWYELLDQNEFGIVLDDLREDESRLRPESLVQIPRIALIPGVETA